MWLRRRGGMKKFSATVKLKLFPYLPNIGAFVLVSTDIRYFCIFLLQLQFKKRPIFALQTLWCGWAIKGERDSFFFAGDTGYCPEFKNIGHFYGPFTIAAIPIGCYSPRWFMTPQHIDPAEAVKIHNEIRAKNSLAIHWGTYAMGSNEVISHVCYREQLTKKANFFLAGPRTKTKTTRRSFKS